MKKANRHHEGLTRGEFMEFGYTAVERYEPDQKYKDWCKLYHVVEVVSIDTCLCPQLFWTDNFSDEDYQHAVWLGDYVAFSDVEYLLQKVSGRTNYQLLALLKNPGKDCSRQTPDERFKFYGYDLIEPYDDNSALTNCGGFDKAFQPSDISPFGLIEDFQKAQSIQQRLLEEYPDLDDADCSIWAIWRMDS